MYHKLAGMTGTAKTEETEFMGIYNLDVVEIPTNKPVKRVDYNDVVCIKQQENTTPLSKKSFAHTQPGSRFLSAPFRSKIRIPEPSAYKTRNQARSSERKAARKRGGYCCAGR